MRLSVTDRDPNRAHAMGPTVLKCWPNARDLVQVVADAGNLAGAVALCRGRGPSAGSRHGLPQRVGQRHAGGLGLGPPGGGLGVERRGTIAPGPLAPTTRSKLSSGYAQCNQGALAP